MSALEIRRLAAFGNQILVDTERGLALLQTVDPTLAVLNTDRRRVEQMNRAAGIFVEQIKDAPGPIASDTDLIELFDKVRDYLGNAHQLLEARRHEALNMPSRRKHDGVAEAYALLIGATAELHNRLNELSWAIGEHNADFEKPTGKAYTDIEDMFQDMGV